MRKRKIVLTLGIFSIAVLFACKKEQPEMNGNAKDPCDCASEVSADFTMEEASYFGTNFEFTTEADSILKGQYVLFNANQEDAEYLWYLGTETESTKDTYRQFDNSLTGTTQPIILVVKKEPNKLCFPEDDGYDSIVKYITITNYPIYDYQNNDIDYGTKEGVFRVKNEESQDSIEITIDFILDQFNNQKLNIFNFDGSGNDCIETIDEYRNTYRETRFSPTDIVSCNQLRGYIKTLVNGSVEMYFTQMNPSDPDYHVYHYFGRRIGSL